MPPSSATRWKRGAATPRSWRCAAPTRRSGEFLSDDELVALFDMGYHTKHVDTIFKRVFG